MALEPATATRRPVALHGELVQEGDPRVAAVLEVLRGRAVGSVARRWSVDVGLLHRWVGAFVAAGTAQVTNRPEADVAQQRDRFLAAFAHEIRTPLAVAEGWVTLLEDDLVPRPVVAQSVRKLHDALDRLTDRTRDVELLASASLGRLCLSPAVVALGDLVANLSGLDEVRGDGPDTTVIADPDMFRRILRDLWLAAQSRPSPRRVGLWVSTVPPWTEVRVVRDADPVDPRVLQALFEPFDLNDDGTGVTIGLYLARALAVAHGGTIGVEQDDEGAAFWVRIPTRPTEIPHTEVTHMEET